MSLGQTLQIIHGGIPLLNGIAHLDQFQLLQCYVESKQNQGMCTVFSLQLLCQWLLLHSCLESVFDWWNVIWHCTLLQDKNSDMLMIQIK